MEPHQQPNPPPRSSRHPHLQHIQPPQPSPIPQRTANSTPVSSPGLFSPTVSRLNMNLPQHAMSEGTSPAPTPGGQNVQSGQHAQNGQNSPFLHPLQTRKVRETYTANVDRDYTTGRKHINQYEVREEIGRGQHGKVKLARNLHTDEMVAIKIIPRFSKKRRLGKVTAEDPQRNTKREIAILKKIRHPNVVALLEVIDDPELKKIYMVLEHVELGEMTWRKKGLPHICQLERRRYERGQRGEPLTAAEDDYMRHLERKSMMKSLKRQRARNKESFSEAWTGNPLYWSLEYGPFREDLDAPEPHAPVVGSSPFQAESRTTSQAPSRNQSAMSLSRVDTPSHPSEPDLTTLVSDAYGNSRIENPTPIRPDQASPSALEGTISGPGAEEAMAMRARSPSMADSIISHMSSVDFGTQAHDPFGDDFSYVPCFTMDEARSAFRDTVLGLEYLHYNGVVHRDIKPANLLWTREHQVKISDFGVSYFGRPVRDGEPVELVSEAEALDFDDDRELAKTVGTPAFFAPELCYADGDQPQPRVSEQIDVWSLGVTLYCIIFARIPFLAEDEFSMFRKIATEDVYIPRRRLRPVFPFTDPSKISLFKRGNMAPYRDDEDASYENIDDDLHDLLWRMLIKDPEKRIRLPAVKSHPWLVKGISNLNSWMDETDPSRKMSGRPIEVDEKEIGRAVVPLTFLERARSAVKKAVGKVIHHRTDREESSRRRAPSSATSSVGDWDKDRDSLSNPPSANPLRDARRKSIRGDDYFATVTQMPTAAAPVDHPLSQSVSHTPQDSPVTRSPTPSIVPSEDVQRVRQQQPPLPLLPPPPQQQQPTQQTQPQTQSDGPQKPLPRHASLRSIGRSFLNLTHSSHESQTVPPSPIPRESREQIGAGVNTDGRTGRETSATLDGPSSRARSLDRAGLVFPHADKHAKAEVGLSVTVVPGTVQQPPRSPRPVRSVDLGAALSSYSNQIEPSAGLFPRLATAYRLAHPKSDTNIQEKRRSMVDMDERPSTAYRIEAGLVSTSSTATPSGTLADGSALDGRHESERQQRHNQHLAIRTAVETDPGHVACPTSPSGCGDDDESANSQSQYQQPPSREETMSTAVSSSFTSLRAIATPMTSPSVVASPICHTGGGGSAPISREASEAVAAMLAFQSDPSLPALLSGASSVSADVEGDFLGNPGVVSDRSSALIATTDSLTPPAPAKDPVGEFPLDQPDLDNLDAIAVRLDSGKEGEQGTEAGAGGVIAGGSSSAANATATAAAALHPVIATSSGPRPPPNSDCDDGDSDSDEGLMMTSKKKGIPWSPQLHPYHSQHYHTTQNQHQHQHPQYNHHHHQHQHSQPHHQYQPTGSLAIAARRRDTNTSIGSTETAKKVDLNGEALTATRADC